MSPPHRLHPLLPARLCAPSYQIVTSGPCSIDRGGFIVIRGVDPADTEGWAQEIAENGGEDNRGALPLDGLLGGRADC